MQTITNSAELISSLADVIEAAKVGKMEISDIQYWLRQMAENIGDEETGQEPV